MELDFGDRLVKGFRDSRLFLFLQGSVEYETSTSSFAAAQAGLRLKAPSIFVERGGRWVELLHEAGYPAGILHTMTLDVTGKILPGDRKIRIASNMELYWDRIFLAEHHPGEKLSFTESPVRSADLHFFGYPRSIHRTDASRTSSTTTILTARPDGTFSRETTRATARSASS